MRALKYPFSKKRDRGRQPEHTVAEGHLDRLFSIRPIVPPLLLFATGILFASLIDIQISLPLYVAILLVISLVCISVTLSTKYHNYIFLNFFLIGLIYASSSLSLYPQPNHIKNLTTGRKYLPRLNIQGVLYRSPEVSGERTKLYINAEKVFSGKRVKDVSGKILITVEGRGLGLSYGDRIRFRARLKLPHNLGNPGEFDYSGYLGAKGIFITGFIPGKRWIVKISGGGLSLWKLVSYLRLRAAAFMESENLAEVSLAEALLVGRRSSVPDQTRNLFAKTGTAHIFAISGLHIGVVAIIFYTVISFLLRLSERVINAIDTVKVASLATLPPVLLYSLFTGFSLPTRRALLMMTVFLTAIMLERRRDTFNALAVAAFTILIISPSSLYDLSFQLSFAALLSILYLTPRIKSFFPALSKNKSMRNKRSMFALAARIGRKAALLLIISFSALVGTAPVTAYYFHTVSLAGLLANIFIVPLVGFVAVPAGIAALAVAPLWHFPAHILIHISGLSISAAVYVARLFVKIPYSSVQISGTRTAEVFVISAAAFLFFSVRDAKWKKRLIASVIALLFLYHGWNYYESIYRPVLKVTFVSVGQGESALVTFPSGKNMLIDGGSLSGPDFDVGERVIAPFLRLKGIRSIDIMALSHLQHDHAAGLNYIASNFPVREFWWNGEGSIGRLGKILEAHSVSIERKDSTSKPITLGGVAIQFLNPVPGEAGINDRSLVIKLSYGKTSFLFTGDIEKEGEARLVERWRDALKTTVVKVPHHGSPTSSTKRFIGRIHPQIAVISVGYKNHFRFPGNGVLKRYRDAGAEVFRTDLDGAVTITSDGASVRVSTYRPASLIGL